MAKFLDILFHILTRIGLVYVKYVGVVRPIKGSVAALPYCSEDWPGGNERIGNWKKYFEEKDMKYEVFWASNEEEFLKYHDNDSVLKKYGFYFKVLYRRIKLIKHLRAFESIWIQRSYIPFYPYKDAFFEKALSRFHPNITIDFYDADYVHNYDLIVNSASAVKKVTAATPFLVDFFKEFNPNTSYLRMTITDDLYKEKIDYGVDGVLKIGWMGSPGNSEQLVKIEQELNKIEKEYNVKFEFVCRKFPSISLEKYKVLKWGDENFEYQKWLQSVDIGIVPYIGNSDVLKAKPAMKTLEFMATGIPIVASEWGVLGDMKNGADYLLVDNDKSWEEQIGLLVKDENLRKKIGRNGLRYYKEYHTYRAGITELEKILLG